MRTAPLPRRLPTALLLVAGLPAEAHAHTAMPGVNHFMGGVLHPVMTPAHVLILLGLGILLGQHLPLRLRLPVLTFAMSAAIGLALTTAPPFTMPPPVLIAIALCAAVAVAVGRPLPSVAKGVLFAAGGIAIGCDSGVETGSPGVVFQTLIGTWLGLTAYLFCIAYYASLAAERKKQWIQIALRVAGSWIVAISLLMLAFALRK